ncbi:MAG: carbohydate-binding domain-containing protein, partial [Bacteroidota bacterium]
MDIQLRIVLTTVLIFIWSDGILAQSTSQKEKSMIPGEMKMHWDVETNFLEDGDRYKSVFTLKNEGKKALPDSGWALYFNYLGVIDSVAIPSEIELTLINGNFYKLEPTKYFNGISAGEEFAIPFEGAGSKIKEGDAPVGAYFVDRRNDEIISVKDVEVGSFDKTEQRKRGPDDNMPHR